MARSATDPALAVLVPALGAAGLGAAVLVLTGRFGSAVLVLAAGAVLGATAFVLLRTVARAPRARARSAIRAAAGTSGLWTVLGIVLVLLGMGTVGDLFLVTGAGGLLGTLLAFRLLAARAPQI